MSNSALVSYTRIVPHSDPRRDYIRKITIHHMAGNLSVETCGAVLNNRGVSANYGIGSDGRIGLYVDEGRRSWASASPSNDHQAVTMEVANDRIGGNWHVSDAAYKSMIDLCVDICRRNGIPRLIWTGDSRGTLTIHKMFYPTACPGPYLEGKMAAIAAEVNRRLASVPTTKREEMCDVQVPILRHGDKSGYVRTMQVLLNAYNGADLTEDGIFGPATDRAVRAYQRSRGLDVDGIVGAQTWAQLLK